MKHLPDVAGTAALTTVEALMLALNDRNILPEDEIVGVLIDAAETHTNAAKEQQDGSPDLNLAVAGLIKKIVAGRNSVRRP